MAETPNYELYVSSNNQEDFLNWREKIAGENGSNFHKIDNALKQLSDDIENILIGSPDAITIPDGGEVILDNDLIETIGGGPYILEFTHGDDDTGGAGSGGSGSINGIKNVTIEAGENITVLTDVENSKVTISATTPNIQHPIYVAPNILVNGSAPFVNQTGVYQIPAADYRFPVDGCYLTGTNMSMVVNNEILIHTYGNSDGHCRQYIQEECINCFNTPHILSMKYFLYDTRSDTPQEAFITFGGINNDGTEVEYYKKSLGFGEEGGRFKKISFEITDEYITEWPALYYVDLTVPSGHSLDVEAIKLEENTVQTLWLTGSNGSSYVLRHHDYCENLLRCQQNFYPIIASGNDSESFGFQGFVSNNNTIVHMPLTLPTRMACIPKVFTKSLTLSVTTDSSNTSSELTPTSVNAYSKDLQHYNLTLEFASAVGTANTACWIRFISGWLALVADIKADALE